MAGEILRDVVSNQLVAGNEPLDIKPPWLLKEQGEPALGKWVTDTFDSLAKFYTEDIQTMRQNLAWYAGDWEKAIEYMLITPTGNRIQVPRSVVPKAINHLWRITEEHVAHMSRFRPVIQTIPHDSEASDAASARLGEKIVKQAFNLNNFTKIQETIDRWVKIFGEAYISVNFDENRGDRKLTKEGRPIKNKKNWSHRAYRRYFS